MIFEMAEYQADISADTFTADKICGKRVQHVISILFSIILLKVSETVPQQ